MLPNVCLDNSIMEVFYQLDTNESGKVSIQDFIHLCEVLKINFVDADWIPSLKDDEGEKNLPESKSRDKKINILWTDNQRPFWDLFAHTRKESLNAEEFKICLHENWAATNVKVTKIKNINATKQIRY